MGLGKDKNGDGMTDKGRGRGVLTLGYMISSGMGTIHNGENKICLSSYTLVHESRAS